MPSIFLYLLRYAHSEENKQMLSLVEFTLLQMARGGIFDQLGGGFSRYSVDNKWFAPHFEKMLYDNAQLISLYAEAYRASGNLHFKKTFESCINFVFKELTHNSNLFYTALDADSEGLEGKYYTWEYSELEKLIPEELDLVTQYYNVSPEGNWEMGRNILFRKTEPEAFCREKGYELADFENKLLHINNILLASRNTRIRPSLDHKTILANNALMITALVDAYKAGGTELYRLQACKTAKYLLENSRNSDGGLNRILGSTIRNFPALLDDKAFLIRALLDVFFITQDENWVWAAKDITDQCFADHFDPVQHLFLYNPRQLEIPVGGQFELTDLVQPSSNAVMAHNLFILSHLFANSDWTGLSLAMVERVADRLQKGDSAYAYWAWVHREWRVCGKLITVAGEGSDEAIRELQTQYLPGTYIAKVHNNSQLPGMIGKSKGSLFQIFVCDAQQCQGPFTRVQDVLLMAKKR